MGQTGSLELRALRERVAAWRKQGGGRGSRIPEPLWDEAVRVARTSGLHATAQATRFNYERLKERSGKADGSGADTAPVDVRAGAEQRADLVVEGSKKRAVAAGNGGTRGAGVADGARFVALQMAPGRAGSQTMIELVGRDGERMRVEVTGEVDVVGLVQTFWSRQS